MSSPVRRRVALDTVPWPTTDPFLFCVHHLDRYPTANEEMGPDAPLTGRLLGQDFEGIDGWRMYHGVGVPGFPAHPHRGFETVTYVRQGLVDHADSLGAAARYGRGDVQWLTAGAGLVHAEMFPLLDRGAPNTLELFQIWLNLPAEDKMAEPHFAMLWDHEIPRVRIPGGEVTVIAGAFGEHVPPPPPPRSWAARPDTGVVIWHIRLDPGAGPTLPAADHPGTVRTLYVFGGADLHIEGDPAPVSPGAAAEVSGDEALEVTSEGGADVLVLGGRPIDEPVAQYGPFVLNDREGIEQAFADYRRTGFGGWPWPAEDPVHGAERGRFARHADGGVEEPAGI